MTTKLSEEDCDILGQMLEDKGLSHSEIDSYFEHHGVRGMRWGVRRANLRTANNAVAEAKISLHNAKEVRSNQRKDALRAAAKPALVTAGILAGAAATAFILTNHGSTPHSSIKVSKTTQIGSGWLMMQPKNNHGNAWRMMQPDTKRNFIDVKPRKKKRH